MRQAMSVSLAVAVTVALAAGIVLAPRVGATDRRGVTSWVEISSTTPAVGCTIDVSVEVRAGGSAVDRTEAAVGLFTGGGLIGADRRVTDGGGVAHLSVDTSGAAAGADAWLDVNVAGAYIGGVSIVPGSGGGCTGGGTSFSTSADVPAVQIDTAPSVDVAAAGDVSTGTQQSGGFVADIVTYGQQRNLSCEYAALQIATSAWGNGISEYAFDDVVGWSANPHLGYRGDINGSWGNTDDYGVYAEPLASALAQFGFNGDAFYAQGDASELTSRLDRGIPTLVWIALWGDQSQFEASGGVSYKLVAGKHVVVAYGYDDSGVYVSDPATAGTRLYSWGDFMSMWNVMDGMALAVSPA